jgi:hypothetical protein
MHNKVNENKLELTEGLVNLAPNDMWCKQFGKFGPLADEIKFNTQNGE